MKTTFQVVFIHIFFNQSIFKMKVKILFPQIVFEQKEVEVTEEEAENLIEHHIDRAKFIWDNMTEQEQDWSLGEKMIEHYLDDMKLITRIN